jgi:hypothetical protein
MQAIKTLRNAATLKSERDAIRLSSNYSSHVTAIHRAVEEIERAHASGKKSVWSLTFPDSVVKELEANGYTVKYHNACGAGDMDSHEISWS